MFIRSMAASLRWIVFFLAMALLIAWTLAGPSLAKRFGKAAASPEETTNKIIERLKVENPQAAAELERIRASHDIRAVAAVLREADVRGGTAAVGKLVDRPGSSVKTPSEIRLASLAVDPHLAPSAASRDEFLWAHASAVEMLDQDGTGEAADAYLKRLEHSAQLPDTWRAVRADAMAMLVYDCVASPELREYYDQEQEWLDAVLVDVSARVDASGVQKRLLVAEVVHVAYQNRPYFKLAVTEQKLDAAAFFLFDQYGDVIRLVMTSGGMSLEELLEVLFANGDYLERSRGEPAEKLASRLVHVHDQQPAVWKAARKTRLALRLSEDAPGVADRLFDKYAADDIALLLYAGYENEIAPAAAAVARFGDLAIYVLNQYVQSPRFHETLARPDVGPRLIPYMARFGDQGIERLKDNQGWLDKYFEPNGTPKEEAWWTQIPGGGALAVAKNWARGYPNEWSELGWGALDVADAALLVASLGSSAVVTETAKEGSQVVGKSIAKAEVKREILRAGQHRAAREVAVDGAREAARKESQSLLRRALAQGVEVSRVIRGSAGKTWRLIAAVGNGVMTPTQKILDAAKTFHGAWQSVPATYRKIVYRSLLAVGLFVTFSERTIPSLSKIGEAAGEFAGQVLKNSAQALAAGLKQAIDTALEGVGGGAKDWITWGVYLIMLPVLVAVVWTLWPLRKEKLRYV